jgi:hypothetical protein
MHLTDDERQALLWLRDNDPRTESVEDGRWTALARRGLVNPGAVIGVADSEQGTTQRGRPSITSRALVVLKEHAER